MMVPDFYSELQARSEKFCKITGRRPRILLSGVNDYASSRSLKALAVGFADSGFDVDISPVSASCAAIAKMACENDVHVIGISGWTGDQETLVRDMTQALADQGGDNITIYVDGCRTGSGQQGQEHDYEMHAAGYAEKILELIGA